MLSTRTGLCWVIGLGGGIVAGCSSGTTSEAPSVVQGAALRRAQSCEDLTASLRADALAKMNRRIDTEIRAVREGYPYGYYPYGPRVAVDDAAPNAGGNAETTPRHSETETQVEGVDEADIVKAEGTRLYVLHGQKFLIVDAWPAPSLGLAGGIDIEGQPTEMFVTEDRAVVFSVVDGSALYAAAGVPARPAYADGYGWFGRANIELADVAVGPGGSPGLPAGAAPLTKVTVLELEGASATVERELYFEGGYLSSRRVDASVRVVLTGGAHGPALDYTVPYAGSNGTSISPEARIQTLESLRDKNAALIEATTYADWVPVSFVKDAGGVRAETTACGDFYVPGAGSTEFGMTQIAAFDLGAPGASPRSLAILGDADTVYGDATSMVLAARAWVDPWVLVQNNLAADPARAASIPVQTLDYTHLHLFDVATAQPGYVGSGTVPGAVPGQFAIDQRDGRVRVTTNEWRSGPPRDDGKPNQVSRAFVLENREGALTIQGDAGEIAPGEQLYATRFVGDKLYIVTWHVVDPLFVIDLADASHPRVLGQLKIPGFSEYMRPLDDNHLITIGRETDETGHQHTDDGYWYGVAIQIFDVTDPLHPALKHKYLYGGGDYATTEASQNHKAFTYFEDKKLLAFPYVIQGSYGTSAGPASTLEVFRVDVADGIRKVGSVDHSSLLGTTAGGRYGYCGGYFDGAVRRGVFFEDVVYSISYGGILANDVANLATPVASYKLENPSMSGLTCQ